MKHLKLLFVIIFMSILTGCDANIDLIVDTSFNIEESATFSVKKEFIEPYYSSVDEIKKNYYDYLEQYNKDSEDFELNVYYKDNKAIGTAKKKGKLKKVSGIDSILFKKIEKEDNVYKIFFSDELNEYFNPNLEIDYDPEGVLEKLEINIQFHNVITDNNSDSYDYDSNTYTWQINKDNLVKNIEFTITDEKRYDIIIPYLLKKNIFYIVIGIIIVAISIFVGLIMYKAKKENKI